MVVEITPSAAAGLTSRDDIAALHICEVHEGSSFDMTDYGTTYGKGRATGWGVTKIGAPTVWETPYNFTGEDIVVAVIDKGCRYTHYDLRDHLWVNEDEIPDNGIDDDDNGYIDDTLGWDFGFPDEEGDDNDPWFWTGDDSSYHGTMTTGIVGSDGTAGNFCGVAPDAMLMIIRAPEVWKEGAEERIWTAMEYMTDNGADVASASGGADYALGPDYFSWRQAIENMMDAGVVCVVAAGNEYEDQDEDPIPHNVITPADVPDVIAAGGTDINDVIAWFSSTGPVPTTSGENLPRLASH